MALHFTTDDGNVTSLRCPKKRFYRCVLLQIHSYSICVSCEALWDMIRHCTKLREYIIIIWLSAGITVTVWCAQRPALTLSPEVSHGCPVNLSFATLLGWCNREQWLRGHRHPWCSETTCPGCLFTALHWHSVHKLTLTPQDQAKFRAPWLKLICTWKEDGARFCLSNDPAIICS